MQGSGWRLPASLAVQHLTRPVVRPAPRRAQRLAWRREQGSSQPARRPQGSIRPRRATPDHPQRRSPWARPLRSGPPATAPQRAGAARPRERPTAVPRQPALASVVVTAAEAHCQRPQAQPASPRLQHQPLQTRRWSRTRLLPLSVARRLAKRGRMFSGRRRWLERSQRRRSVAQLLGQQPTQATRRWKSAWPPAPPPPMSRQPLARHRAVAPPPVRPARQPRTGRPLLLPELPRRLSQQPIQVPKRVLAAQRALSTLRRSRRQQPQGAAPPRPLAVARPLQLRALELLAVQAATATGPGPGQTRSKPLRPLRFEPPWELVQARKPLAAPPPAAGTEAQPRGQAKGLQGAAKRRQALLALLRTVGWRRAGLSAPLLAPFGWKYVRQVTQQPALQTRPLHRWVAVWLARPAQPPRRRQRALWAGTVPQPRARQCLFLVVGARACQRPYPSRRVLRAGPSAALRASCTAPAGDCRGEARQCAPAPRDPRRRGRQRPPLRMAGCPAGWRRCCQAQEG